MPDVVGNSPERLAASEGEGFVQRDGLPHLDRRVRQFGARLGESRPAPPPSRHGRCVAPKGWINVEFVDFACLCVKGVETDAAGRHAAPIRNEH